VAEANLDVHRVHGDVTRLETLSIGGGFDLLVDRGCFHGLSDEQRDRYAAGASALAAPGAVFLLHAHQPRKRGIGPGPRGITRHEIERRFGHAWELIVCAPDTQAHLPRWLGDFDPM